MSLSARVFRPGEDLGRLAAAWDALPPSRGVHADVYDSHAWFAAWLGSAAPRSRARAWAVGVFDGDTLAAIVPLLAEGLGSHVLVGHGFRPRYRAVLSGERPREDVLALLAETLRRARCGRLLVPAQPSLDPATALLQQALGREGYAIATRTTSSDCVALVSGGWAEHAARLRTFARNVKTRSNKARQIGEIELQEHGPGALELQAGFQAYVDVHAQSWKGTLRDPMLGHRRELVRRTGALGWCRIFVLRVAGVPVAAHVWFLLGATAISYSQVYDRRGSAIGAGSVLSWLALERIFATHCPRVVDYLPGEGPQKETLAPDRFPLVTVEATASRRLVAPLWSLRAQARRGLAHVRQRARASARRAREARAARRDPALPHVVPPARVEHEVRSLGLDAATEIWLASAGEHGSTTAMQQAWLAGDAWWSIGDGPLAAARVGTAGAEGAPLRELVLVPPANGDVARIVSSLATSLGRPVLARDTKIRRAAFPWPGTR